MSTFKPMNARNFLTVLDEIAAQFLKADKQDKVVWIAAVDQMLSDLCCNDFFGTEGQNDPRGDHRK
jgi:hypothetical protein